MSEVFYFLHHSQTLISFDFYRILKMFLLSFFYFHLRRLLVNNKMRINLLRKSQKKIRIIVLSSFLIVASFYVISANFLKFKFEITHNNNSEKSLLKAFSRKF